MKAKKKEALSTPSRTIREEVLGTLKTLKADLDRLAPRLNAELISNNAILANLRRRVSALEKKQGMGETKRVAMRGQAQSKKKGA
jgi:hypothetical protein